MKRTSTRIITGFSVIIILGSILLYFFGYEETYKKNWIDTIFTVTSGICVTGLTVMDISKRLSLQGQFILLILIQVGGLGVLTISNWLTLSFRGKMKINQVDSTNKTLGYLSKLSPAIFIRRIFLFTFISELTGTFILFLCFLKDHSAKEALFLGLFHSVSAFCNAGFTLFSNSLESFHSNLIINTTVILLIFVGGIGFVVMTDLYERIFSYFKKQNTKISLQSKISLATSAWLVGSGAILLYFFEFNNTLEKSSFFNAALESVFLSVTSRTAGFNTIPTEQLTSMSLISLIFLMMIGASSGSTGGGIKTSTAAVFWALLKSNFRKRENVEIFSRTITYTDVSKVITIIFCYVLMVFISVTLLQMFESSGIDPRFSRGTFLEHLFEVVSALSTVGLSTGVTPTLSVPGKVVIIACMFAGRVGLLALIASVMGRKKKLMYKYPIENIMVG